MRKLFCLPFLLLFLAANAQDSTVAKRKKSFVFDINAGPIATNAISNFDPDSYHAKYYSQTPGVAVCYGYGGGAEFLWSQRADIKQLLGLTYTLTRSDFREDSDIIPGTIHTPTTHTHLRRRFTYQAADLIYGVRLSPVKKLHVIVAIAYSYVFNGKEEKYGYSSTYISYYPYPNYYDSTSYNGTINHNSARYLSWRVKLGYDFAVKGIPLAVFSMFNWGIGYRLPYVQVGLQWYPFRKMR